MRVESFVLAFLVSVVACAEQQPAAADAVARDSTVVDSARRSGAQPVDAIAELVPGLVDTPAVLSSRDSLIPIVDPDDLVALGSRMAIPVQGFEAAKLRDTYTEPRGGRVHEALDIIAPRGTPVLAAIDGQLTKLHSSVAGGLMVYAADAGDRFVFMYGHLDRYADGLKAGMPLKRGQVIGYVGTTGNAPAGTPHLHFAVARGKPSAAWWKGTPVNPYPLLVPSTGSRTRIAEVPVVVAPKPIEMPPAAPAPTARQLAIEPRAEVAITAIGAHDMAALAKLVHPTKGLRFTPYTRVDLKTDRRFTRDQVLGLWTNKSLFVWGSHDGTGAPIRLTFAEYHKAFVYDYDFVKAPRVAYDAEPMGTGNSLNNIREIYKDAIVVEYHVPAVDAKYAGMDWRSLWLVFEKSGADWYLTGIVHGRWTV